MNNVKYFSLAAARAENPKQFDETIKNSFHQATKDVGMQVAISAFCKPSSMQKSKAA